MRSLHSSAIRLAYAKQRRKTVLRERYMQDWVAIGAVRGPGDRWQFLPQLPFKPHGIAIFGAVMGETMVHDLKVANWCILASASPVDATLFNPGHQCLHYIPADQFRGLEFGEVRALSSHAVPVEFVTCDVGCTITMVVKGPCSSIAAWGRVARPAHLPDNKRTRYL